MDEIIVNGERYVKHQKTGTKRIVILQRGWVMIGDFEREGSECRLFNASVIRKWGTTKGLGQLAENGPFPETVLDACFGVVEFDYLTVIATISVDESKWQNVQ